MDSLHSTIHASCSRGPSCRKCWHRTLTAYGYDAEAYDREAVRHKTRVSVQKWRQKYPGRRNELPSTTEARAHGKRYRMYGLTKTQYTAMVAQQQGRCWLCQKPETAVSKFGQIKSLHVDHDHATGEVRGLLCQQCNQILGVLEKHGLAWFFRAIAYLS